MILQKILVEKSPWHMLVGCCLLNLTSREQVDKVWPDLFATYGDDPEEFIRKMNVRGAASGNFIDREHLTHLIRPLGLAERRTKTLIKLSESYLDELDRVGYDLMSMNLLNVYGCGKYAMDSWNIFVRKFYVHHDDVTDKVLKKYLEAVNSPATV